MLSLYNSCLKFFERVTLFFKKIYAVVVDTDTSNNYIFFININHPVHESLTHVESSKSALPEWRYIADKYQFLEWYPGGNTSVKTSVTSHSLPILSMEILDGEETIYDLTEFIESIRVYNSSLRSSSPNINHIVQAWMLTARTVLNPSRNFIVRYIDETANTKEQPFAPT